MEELAQARSMVSNSQSAVELKERDILRERTKRQSNYNSSQDEEHYNDNFQDSAASVAKKKALKTELAQRWQELGTPIEERVLILASILDAVPLTPAMVSKYESVLAKLAARLPIMEMLSRRQYIEYKLKLAQRSTNPGGQLDTQALNSVAELTDEINELQASIDASTRAYEERFAERFTRPALVPGTPAGISGRDSSANGAGLSSPMNINTSGRGQFTSPAGPSHGYNSIGGNASVTSVGSVSQKQQPIQQQDSPMRLMRKPESKFGGIPPPPPNR
jgi:hypothetical protein